MAVPVVSDELWAVIKPLLPECEPQKTGRPRVDDRRCFSRISFVLATGIAWGDLPQQLGYGSGVTCWRRLRDW
jgi:transposase